jgi:amino-acid N-acetyltransferase
VRNLYLLTTTAERYFKEHGYEAVDRASAPPDIQGTRQFAGLCPASSAFMVKALT